MGAGLLWLFRLPSSFLVIDDDGVAKKEFSIRYHWTWSELSPCKIYRRGLGDGFIWFHVPEALRYSDLARRLVRVAPGRSEVRVRDIYDTKLDEIAAELNARRRRALEAKAVTEDELAEAPHHTEHDPAPAYLANNNASIQLLAVPAVMCLHLALLAPYLWYRPSATLIIFGFALLLCILVLWYLGLHVFPTMPPMDNILRLDAEGFTVTRSGKGRRWTWDEISAFRRRGTAGLPSKYWGGLLIFEVPDDTRQSALWRRLSKRLFGRPLAVIPDMYLAPLDEIERDLNQHWARATNDPSGQA